MGSGPVTARDDIAIIGMACLFPGAADLGTYWQNIVSKVDAVKDPPEGWDPEGLYDPGRADNDLVYCVRGGYLGELACFDPLKYGVMPNSVDGGDPNQFLALHVAHEAFADAGYLDRQVDGTRVEVIIGKGTYVNRAVASLVQHGLLVDQIVRILKDLNPAWRDAELKKIRHELKASLPPLNAEVAPGLVPNIVSGRIANRLDFMGTNYTVDAACASSLVAVELAMRDLQGRRCDLALVGGVQASTPGPVLMPFCQLGALSRRGEIRPFDKDADGTLLGEGVGFVVLKRKEDAERDGDRTYAVLKAVGTASDGRAVGLLAPRLEGEILALRRAYEASGIEPSTVGLIEAHGTGTPVGDATEIQALSAVFGVETGPSRCAVGSVKSMIGHALPAAGMAGLIKAALALHHKVLPATLHCEQPDPRLGLDGTPFYVNTETRPWIHGVPGVPRRAGVNAFGFGGINAHAILEEHVGASEAEAGNLHWQWDSEVLIVTGESREALLERVRAVEGYLAGKSSASLKDLAYTLNVEDGGLEGESGLRLAVVAATAEDARHKLHHALERLARPETRRLKDVSGIYFCEEPLGRQGSLAFLFPGEGSQYLNMLGDLCVQFPEVRRWFDLIDRAFADHTRGYVPSAAIFPPLAGASAGAREAAEQRLWQMDMGAEAVFTASQALLALVTRLGIRAQAVVGHSTGEYSALLAAGIIPVEGERELIEHVVRVNEIYQRLAAAGRIPRAVLVAVGTGNPAAVSGVVQGSGGMVHLAMDNCPHQVVLCATESAREVVVGRLKRAGVVWSVLPFDRAYHTPLFAPLGDALRDFFDGLSITAPRVPVYSCATAAPYPDDPAGIRELAVTQWARQVRFRETIEAMYVAGVRVFVEVGPRNNLTAFVADILRKRPHLAVATNVPQRSGVTQLNHFVGLLAAHGVPMQLRALYERRLPRRLTLDGAVDGAREGRGVNRPMRLPVGLAPLRLPPDRPQALASRPREADGGGMAPARVGNETQKAGPARGARGTREERVPGVPAGAVKAYLETMEGFLRTQEEVMQGFLAGRRRGAPTSLRPRHLWEGRAPEPSRPLTAGSTVLLGRIVSIVPGEELTAVRDLDVEEDIFFKDHTLGGSVSAVDEGLVALPVMPLTMSMEVLAEAASALAPGRLVIGMREVRAHRWAALDRGRLPIRIAARRVSDNEVRAEFRESGDPADGNSVAGPPIVEAIVMLGDRYTEPPPLAPFTLREERGTRWRPEQLYTEGMFHGPSFRGVLSVDRWGDDGAEATLGALPADRLFCSELAPHFLIDPVVLDAAGQLVGYWMAERSETGFNVFPYRVEGLEVYGRPLRPPERARCRARIGLVGDAQVRSDIDVVGPDGRLRMRLTGWWDRRFDLPRPLYGLRVSPRTGMLSVPWRVPIAGVRVADALACCRVERNFDDVLHASRLIWQRVLAHLVLSRRERGMWLDMEGPDRRRTQWLLGRAVAKDAVRLLLRERSGLELFPADVEIVADENGRPLVQGTWLDEVEAAPPVSLAHTKDVVVALAGDPRWYRGVGIDVERVGRVREGFDRAAFTGPERDRLRLLGDVGDGEWSLRFWCAKEALAKAVGTGLLGHPGNFPVAEVDPATGIIQLVMGEAAARKLPREAGRRFSVVTTREQDLIVATAIYERE